MALQYPDIDPVAITLGPVQVHWYALAYLAGFVLGMFYIFHIIRLDRDNGSQPVSKRHIEDFLPWAVLGVILGGRIGYVLFYQFHYYLSEPLSIFQIWRGGMSFHGGALGVVVAMAFFARHCRIPFFRLSDLVCAAVPIGLFFGRIANFINGELYGRVTNVPWAMRFPGGGSFSRHPSQLYEAALEGLVLFAVLAVLIHFKKFRRRNGLITGIFLIGYALARIVVEFFREPDIQLGLIMDVFTLGQFLSLPMLLIGGLLLYRSLKSAAPSAKEEG